MHHKERFQQIKELLKKYHGIWSQEVINTYPLSYEYYPDEWIDELERMGMESLWKLDAKIERVEFENTHLQELIDSMRFLEIIPYKELKKPERLPSWATYNVKGKKLHEIDKVVPLIKDFNKQNRASSAVDIGGGVGHLARILAYYNQLDTTSIDFNKEFQELGKIRAKKYPLPQEAKELNYIHHKFGEESFSNPQLKSLFNGNCISLGLHTCGDLANKHIHMFLKHNNPLMINFGCCYSKIDNENQVNLSQTAKNDPLDLNGYALTLATRGHNQITFEEFEFKKRVKNQRYLLHLYMVEKLGFKEFVTMGNGKAKLYWSDFATYAKESLKKIDYELNISDDELNAYAKENEALINRLFLANILRWQFGRIIELYILLDRAIHIEEQGAKAELYQIIDPKLSPRNIAILASKIQV